MRIALVDTNPKIKYYCIGLLKLGAWRRSLGDECEYFENILPEPGAFDEIWLSTLFTFDLPHSLGLVREAKNRASKIRVGGISASLLPAHFEKEGAEVHQGLHPEAESFVPDYSLLKNQSDFAITHTSRGCIRKCGFCMVPKLEPQFINRGWINDLPEGCRMVLFYDNNWLAKPVDDLRRDADLIKTVAADRKLTIDFNQGLDARLMTEEKADIINGIPFETLRFAFDGMQEDGYYQSAIEMMARRGYRDYLAYVLYNFNDTPKDFWYRIREGARLSAELGIRAKSFPMRYQPILEVDKQRNYVGKNWTLQKRNAISSMLSPNGVFSFTGGKIPAMEEFEYWFGKSTEEFDRMLTYPKLTLLLRRKYAAIRKRRAEIPD